VIVWRDACRLQLMRQSLGGRTRIEARLPKHTWLAVLAMLFVAALSGSGEANATVGRYAFAVGIMWAALRLWMDWQVHQATRNLRRLDDDDRARVLGSITELEVRGKLRQRLESDPGPEVAGSVERFQAESSVVRLATSFYWLVTVLAAAALGGALALQMRAGQQGRSWLLIGAGAVAGVAAIAIRRYLGILMMAIEVSPFAISELHPDGSRRMLRWQHAAWLRRRRWPARWEVLAGNGRERITVNHELVRVYRALALIIEHGGFKPVDLNSPGHG
jgi:hypothetical protein